MAETALNVEKKTLKDRVEGTEGSRDRIIHVPQGLGAKFMRATEEYGFAGLYTEGFSSCNIIVCIGKDKISLSHFDYLNSLGSEAKVKTQIKWTSDPTCSVIIIYRKMGEGIKESLLEYLRTEMPSQKIIEKQMNEQHDGVYVSFKSTSLNNIHPNIKKFLIGEKPDGLIHHPQEQQFLSVRKIEHIIGLRAKHKKAQMRDQEFFMFSGRGWEPLENGELEVDVSHELTKEEMKLFSEDDSYTAISLKLIEIIGKIKQDGISTLCSIEELVMPVVVYLEGYLNKYDYELLFKRNLEEVINNKVINKESFSQEDKTFQKELNAILAKPSSAFKEIEKLVREYVIKSPSTAFKKQFLSEYKTFQRHYQEREYYETLRQERMQIKKEASRMHVKACKRYREGKYHDASALFLESLGKFTYVCLKSDPELASVYYNLGKCCLKIEDYESATGYFNISLNLKQDYTLPKPGAEEIKKIKEALTECTEKAAFAAGTPIADGDVQEKGVTSTLLSSSSSSPSSLTPMPSVINSSSSLSSPLSLSSLGSVTLPLSEEPTSSVIDRPQSLSERAEAVVAAAAGLDRGILVQPEGAGASLHFSGSLSSCVNNASTVPCVVDKQKKKKKGRKKKK